MVYLRTARLASSLLIFLAIGTVLGFYLRTNPEFSFFNFWSYFTVQSNMALAIFFVSKELLRLNDRPMRRSSYENIRGGLTLYMTLTTTMYWLFLHRLLQFTDNNVFLATLIQHSLGLIILIGDYLLNPPQIVLAQSSLFYWLLYPVLYGIFIAIQGSFRHWYPYPFSNLDKLGFPLWAAWNFGILLFISGCGQGLLLWHNRRARLA